MKLIYAPGFYLFTYLVININLLDVVHVCPIKDGKNENDSHEKRRSDTGR